MRNSLREFLKKYIEVDSFTMKVIRNDALGNYLLEIFNILEECDCYNKAVKETTDKVGDIYQKEYDKLAGNSVKKEAYEEVKKKWQKDVDDYNKLVREHSGLQERYNDLNRRYNQLDEEKEEWKEKYEEMRERHEREMRGWHQRELQLGRNEERLRQEGADLRGKLTDTNLRLANSENKVLRLESNIDERNQEIQTLTNRMTTLQLESNNRNNELQRTQQELIRVEEERDERITPLELQELFTNLYQREEMINSLKSRLNQTQEESLIQKLRAEENRLEKLAKRSGIDWDIVQVLRDTYEELARVRQNYNRAEMKTCQDNIETIRQSLLGGDIDTDDLQEVAEKCEKVAELRLKMEQQLEARIEIPPR